MEASKTIQIRPRRAPRARAGFSLLDITISLVILAIGFGSVIYAMLGAMSVGQFARERSAALAAAESVLESMQGELFAEVFARFNDTTADDPPGLAPGADFAVEGLNAAPGDADGLPGRIEFPGNGPQLLEGVLDADLGMPRDLNGDGLAIGALATNYNVLPVRVRVRWSGVRGVSELTLVTTLNNERKGP